MKRFVVALAAMIFLSSAAIAGQMMVPKNSNDIVEHGGGCRKNSPPGQCCHMETATGVVHCH